MQSYLNILDQETSQIINTLKKTFRGKSDCILELLEEGFEDEEIQLFPQLTLLAAQGPKGVKTAKTLALLNLIMYLSTEIHSKVPPKVERNQDFYQRIQLPILVGDLLYSKFFDILCSEDCIEYIEDFIQYIEQLNLAWINYLEEKINSEELCLRRFGEMGKIAMEVGAKSSGANHLWVKTMGEYGFSLATLYGARKMGLSFRIMDQHNKTLQKVIQGLGDHEFKPILSYQAELVAGSNFPQKIIFPPLAVKAVGEN